MDNSSGIRNTTVAKREDNSKLRPLGREYSPGEQAEYSEDRDGAHSVTEKSTENSATREGVHNSDALTASGNTFKHPPQRS